LRYVHFKFINIDVAKGNFQYDMRVIFRILKKGKKGNLKAVWKCEKKEKGKVK
jgi:hypothetical protein